MPSFNYKAVNDLGRRVKGTSIADNEIDLENRLKQVGLELITAQEVKAKRASRLSRIRPKDLILLCLHMEQLNRAGVPLYDALVDSRDICESLKLQEIMTKVCEAVKNGSLLSQSFAAHPRVFDNVFVGLVAAGEKTGNLAEAFRFLGDHLKWNSDIQRKIKKATRYPTVLLVVISGVITVMMTQVVPKLVEFITSQGFDLPWHTRALIATSHAFANYWYLIIGIPLFLIIIGMTLYRFSESVAYKLSSIVLKLPILGPVVRKIDMARFTHFFSVMFSSGIDVLESLDMAKGVVSNRMLQETIVLARNNVASGNSLTASLRMSNQFPTLVVRMFKVGEDSGNMGEALENVNFFYNREVNDSVDAMVGAIQPILTVIMGALIFWIIAAMFGPLYESFSKIKF